MRRRSELRQLERVMSMMRYIPPKVTAGLARSRVRGYRRSPAPPASRTPRVSFMDMNHPRETVDGSTGAEVGGNMGWILHSLAGAERSDDCISMVVNILRKRRCAANAR